MLAGRAGVMVGCSYQVLARDKFRSLGCGRHCWKENLHVSKNIWLSPGRAMLRCGRLPQPREVQQPSKVDAFLLQPLKADCPEDCPARCPGQLEALWNCIILMSLLLLPPLQFVVLVVPSGLPAPS